MDTNLLMWIGGQLVMAAAIWGGIRSDIKSMHMRIDGVEKSAGDAHRRLDAHIDKTRG
ncbi:hypothetical protein [uncultured Paraglaciecola sp.]|uniref:hypothetical protein n=1 Tax=uncultured Paraglaciecola sp. TaxID=1765024 RepID=UPI0026306BCA|nr:hypothetical protein [uncultured Paraglaciecola sp.]